MDLDQLLDMAAQHDITVLEHRGGHPGYWIDTHRLITLQKGLSYHEQRAHLAHELGHAVLNHLSNATGWLETRQENQADRFAAQLLISPMEYEQAEAMYGPDPAALAYALDTTRWIVEAWQKNHRALART